MFSTKIIEQLSLSLSLSLKTQTNQPTNQPTIPAFRKRVMQENNP